MGNQLSGGEQQMLAIGRALMTNPRLLILDEATEGLAPLIRAEIWQCLTRLKAAGQSILVIDKNVETLIRIADRHYLIERGRVVWSGTSRGAGGRARRPAPLPRRVTGFSGRCRRPRGANGNQIVTALVTAIRPIATHWGPSMGKHESIKDKAH